MTSASSSSKLEVWVILNVVIGGGVVGVGPAAAAVAANTFSNVVERESCSPVLYQDLNDFGFFQKGFI